MSKIDATQKNIKQVLTENKNFVIPDYQRPYAWDVERCETLFTDFLDFTFPDGDPEKFDTENSEYYLGSIVGFDDNENKAFEVIDGQQRLTTILLLLRAIFVKLSKMDMAGNGIESLKQDIASCIWETDEDSEYDTNKLKIDTKVATDDDRNEFLSILKNGEVPINSRSKYARNYDFFVKEVDKFYEKAGEMFRRFPQRILNNVIILNVKASDWDSSLRIFNTLNDRGSPLADSDIFKSKLYAIYTTNGKQKEFIDDWKELEKIAKNISLKQGVDDFFSNYMYCLRAKDGNTNTTTIALRAFYKDRIDEQTFENIKILAKFWSEIKDGKEEFGDEISKNLFILKYAPNSMWEYMVSVYFMQNKDENGKLDEKQFAEFLGKLIAFSFAYEITMPGVNALRTPFFPEMVKIVKNEKVDFANFKFDEANFKEVFMTTNFGNSRGITRAILTWWLFENGQNLDDIKNEKLDIEHIFAKKLYEDDSSLLSNPRNLENLGNKVLLEKSINVPARDYHFCDKRKYYLGELGKKKRQTKVSELLKITRENEHLQDFTEEMILARQQLILDQFVENLRKNDLINTQR